MAVALENCLNWKRNYGVAMIWPCSVTEVFPILGVNVEKHLAMKIISALAVFFRTLVFPPSIFIWNTRNIGDEISSILETKYPECWRRNIRNIGDGIIGIFGDVISLLETATTHLNLE